jgi:AraC-like DNA-binding protein
VTAITPPHQERAWSSVMDLARDRPAELSVEDLAEQAGYSPFHFTRMFTLRIGISPGQYLTALRMGRAKELLLTASDPVIDVATAVGYDSLSSFSRRFRSAVGVPPAQLRQLADRISDHEVRPFNLTAGAPASSPGPTSIHRRGDPALWVGWYPIPAPIGLPQAGTLMRGRRTVELPLCPGAPFLLGLAVPAGADALDQLAPVDPVVAVHPAPITGPESITLTFARQSPHRAFPLLSALPSLAVHHTR